MQLKEVKNTIKDLVIKDGQPMRASFEIMQAVFDGFYEGISELNDSEESYLDLTNKGIIDSAKGCIRFGLRESNKPKNIHKKVAN